MPSPFRMFVEVCRPVVAPLQSVYRLQAAYRRRWCTGLRAIHYDWLCSSLEMRWLQRIYLEHELKWSLGDVLQP